MFYENSWPSALWQNLCATFHSSFHWLVLCASPNAMPFLRIEFETNFVFTFLVLSELFSSKLNGMKLWATRKLADSPGVVNGARANVSYLRMAQLRRVPHNLKTKPRKFPTSLRKHSWSRHTVMIRAILFPTALASSIFMFGQENKTDKKSRQKYMTPRLPPPPSTLSKRS